MSINGGLHSGFNSGFNAEQAFRELNPTASWHSLREVREKRFRHDVRDGQPQTNACLVDHGVMIEVLVDGHFGYACTNRLHRAGLARALAVAEEQAATNARWACHHFTDAVRPASVGEYRSPVQSGTGRLSRADLIHLLRKCCDVMQVSHQIISSQAMVESIEVEQNYIASNDARIHQEFVFLNTHFAATAQSGEIFQTRTDGGVFSRSYQAGLEMLENDAILERVRRVGEQALELLSAKDCPNERTTLVLAPDQMMLQLHESVGHPLEIDRILGDERNYAGGSFVSLDDIGALQYGSSLMNVTFDPTVAGELATCGYDDTGAAATREYLIRDGKLERALGGLESQTRGQVPGVSNTLASSWNRAPIDRIGNLNLEPGSTPMDELIGSIESGIYMASNRSWSIDDYRNKFQFSCEYAKRIENGELTETLRNPNYRGITNEFWRGLSEVGDRTTFEVYGTGFCGKGEPNQLTRVGHGSPVCAFGDVEVFGAE